MNPAVGQLDCHDHFFRPALRRLRAARPFRNGPDRIRKAVPLLKARHPTAEWRPPETATEEMLLRAHTPEHVERIKNPAGDFDTDTAAHPGIYEHAARAAGAAVDVAGAALRGQRSFSLMQPPAITPPAIVRWAFVTSATSPSPRSNAREQAPRESRSGISTPIMATAQKTSSRTTRGSPSHRFINSQAIRERDTRSFAQHPQLSRRAADAAPGARRRGAHALDRLVALQARPAPRVRRLRRVRG